MPFIYRLEKVLKFRITKKDEQIEVVKKAEQVVIRIQNEINTNQQTVLTLRQNMYSSGHTMFEAFDNYIKHIYKIIEQLEAEKQEAINILMEERETLIELEKAVKVLEKHKEKAREAYLKEEKAIEMKRMDEVAGVKHFRMALERKNEEEEEEEELKSGIEFNDY